VTSSLSFMKESSWGKPQMNLTSFMDGQIEECMRMVRESRDEASVEIDKANERLYLLFI
jgi:hypothetical protein